MTTFDFCLDLFHLPLNQRIRRWREAVGDHLADVDMHPPSDVPQSRAFTGSMTARLLGSDTIAYVDTAYQMIDRTPERIRRAERETVLINIVLSGECLVAQEGRGVRLKAGDLCIYESVRPYHLEVGDEVKALVVMADRARVEAALGNLRLYTALPLSAASPIGSIAWRYWHDLNGQLTNLDNESAGRLTRVGVDIVTAGLAACHGRNVSGSVCSALTMQRAKTMIASNFHISSLSGLAIAAAIGVSLRRLQELFQEEGTTITDHIRLVRLEVARRQLSDAAFARIPVAKIAENAGFNDHAHFSRTFRQTFGMSPSETRAEAANERVSHRRDQSQ